MPKFTVCMNNDLEELFTFDSLSEARRFARAQARSGHDYEITEGDEYGRRVEYHERPRTDDDRVLQALGAPNASDAVRS